MQNPLVSYVDDGRMGTGLSVFFLLFSPDRLNPRLGRLPLPRTYPLVAAKYPAEACLFQPGCRPGLQVLPSAPTGCGR